MKKTKNGAERKTMPWPTKAAMEQIYAMKLWGDNKSEFYSGDGSHNPDIVNPYLEVVISFLKSFKISLVVCDLGCGDFNIGNALVKHTKQYVAIDIVAGLIAYNQENFKANNLKFQCLDIAKDDLPTGDCVILRQVLQHLSNAEIQCILDKLRDFKYVILTEHVPEDHFAPNTDIISGQGIRLKKQSGIDVLATPFNFKVKEAEQVLSIKLEGSEGLIITTIYKVF